MIALNEESQLDIWSQHETHLQRRRVVLLGASNLTRSFPTVVSLARNKFAEPLSIFTAQGLGRSYGLESGCLGKKFPGIFFSGIWQALARADSAPIHAWLTDIGNDLGYEVSVETILQWVLGCVERLEALGAKIVITDLPLETLRQVSKRKFRLFRSLLFPYSSLRYDEFIERAEALSAALRGLGESRNLPIFSLPNEWYGFDPIHPRKRCLNEMWQAMLGVSASELAKSKPSGDSWLLSTYLCLLQPESWSQFAVSRRATQPNGRLVDGTTIALY